MRTACVSLFVCQWLFGPYQYRDVKYSIQSPGATRKYYWVTKVRVLTVIFVVRRAPLFSSFLSECLSFQTFSESVKVLSFPRLFLILMIGVILPTNHLLILYKIKIHQCRPPNFSPPPPTHSFTHSRWYPSGPYTLYILH